MTRTTIALAAALLMGTATAVLAGEGPRAGKRVSGAMQSNAVRASQPTSMSTNGNLMMNVMDRASAPFACGG